jgi:hypothetical protein
MSWDPQQGAQGQNPYQTPQNPYQTPQNPYQTPPNPYGSIPATSYGGGYIPQQPLPLSVALQQLPRQYWKVLTQPSPQTIAAELGKASWDIILLQLLFQGIIAAIASFLSSLLNISATSFLGGSASSAAVAGGMSLGFSLGEIILVPLGFFIGAGIYYGLARAFGGQGSFLQQAYAATLFSVPLGVVGAVLGLIPCVGSLAALAIGIYSIVLYIFAIMAVHRLSGGSASAVVLIPIAVLFVLLILLIFIGGFFFLSLLMGAR